MAQKTRSRETSDATSRSRTSTPASEAAERASVAAMRVAAGAKTGENLKAEMDDLMGEIDEALEVNAEDFVRSYVQKGGQ